MNIVEATAKLEDIQEITGTAILVRYRVSPRDEVSCLCIATESRVKCSDLPRVHTTRFSDLKDFLDSINLSVPDVLRTAANMVSMFFFTALTTKGTLVYVKASQALACPFPLHYAADAISLIPSSSFVRVHWSGFHPDDFSRMHPDEFSPDSCFAQLYAEARRYVEAVSPAPATRRPRRTRRQVIDSSSDSSGSELPSEPVDRPPRRSPRLMEQPLPESTSQTIPKRRRRLRRGCRQPSPSSPSSSSPEPILLRRSQRLRNKPSTPYSSTVPDPRTSTPVVRPCSQSHARSRGIRRQLARRPLSDMKSFIAQ